MLDALVFLHDGQGTIHRDVKLENILCDSREHFRLADFGLAKEGQFLGFRAGTKPFMAPEMFLNQPYTSAVDVYALGLVIARLLTGSYPRQYRENEGLSWCRALIAHFKRFEERTLSEEASEPEQVSLTALVGGCMLKMKPEERESAAGCLERGDFLWFFSENRKWMLNHSINDSNTIPEGHQDESFPNRLSPDNAKERSKNIGLTEKYEPLEEKELGSEGEGVPEREDMGDQDPTEDVDAEAVTDVRSLTTNEWLSLEVNTPSMRTKEDWFRSNSLTGTFEATPHGGKSGGRQGEYK